MAFGKTTLPAIKPQSVTLMPENGSAIVPTDRPQAAVTRAAVELLTASPTTGMTEADKRVLLGLYIKAVAGFALAVALWTLDWLVFHNPRNTRSFASLPTVQDVREACALTDRLWRRWVVWYWLGGKWAETPTDEFLKKNNGDLLERYSAARQFGDPSEPGCIVPRDLQIIYLREEIERQLPDIEAADDRTRQGYSDALLLTRPDDVLDRMPEEAFPPGVLEKIHKIRADRAERARRAAEHEAYLNSLPEDVRAVRSTVAYSKDRSGWTEDQIMTETHNRLSLVVAAKAEVEARGDTFFRYDFEDGETYFAPRTYGRAERDAEDRARALRRTSMSR
ncbi:hypothetical protein [Hyphomicrobium sp. MC1]|uniref:hypothetical protein n=1 Tax=Hyphomicrobium sp. (strain MC1) TaxID=717785 RepID=UPI000213EACA|nr:hypothetical protein [Hyphomicrobium sp. MC1]CCB64065.1 protein of unknown function [Hyphomicrobium sp. MC1]